MLQNTIGAITTMGDIRDSYTAGHERRVGDLCAALGAEMGLDSDSQEWLRITGMVHDSGKIGIPSESLSASHFRNTNLSRSIRNSVLRF